MSQLPLAPELAPAPDAEPPARVYRLSAAATAYSSPAKEPRSDRDVSRQLREAFEERIRRTGWQSAPTLETPKVVIDLPALRAERAALGEFGGAKLRSPSVPDRASVADLIARLDALYERTAYSLSRSGVRNGLETAPQAPLVTTRVELPPSGKSLSLRQLRARVRNAVRPLYAVRSNLRKCGERRYRRDGGIQAKIRTDDHGSRGLISGLVRCGSVHSCVKCAPRIGSGRADQLRAIVSAHRERTATAEHPEGAVYMLTFTVPHDVGMRCKRLRRHVSMAWKFMQQGAPWQRLKRRMHFLGSVTSRETTHGANGFHPHLHILIAATSVHTDVDLRELEDALYLRWVDCVEKVPGLRLKTPSREHGISLVRSYREDYITKLGLADELLGAHEKKGRGENRTPFQIMADYERDRAPRDAAILREYFKAMKGARALTWSRGQHDLRKVYAAALATTVPEQTDLRDVGFETDVELLRREEREGTTVATLPGRQWDALVRVMRRARGDAEHELVSAAEAHGAVGVEAMLAAAYHLGKQLAEKDPRLRPWLFWLKAPDDAPTSGYTLTTVAPKHIVAIT